MQVNAVLGVDIAKQKFDAYLLVGSKERHKVFHNNQEGFEKLVAWCKNHLTNSASPLTIVMKLFIYLLCTD